MVNNRNHTNVSSVHHHNHFFFLFPSSSKLITKVPKAKDVYFHFRHTLGLVSYDKYKTVSVAVIQNETYSSHTSSSFEPIILASLSSSSSSSAVEKQVVTPYQRHTRTHTHSKFFTSFFHLVNYSSSLSILLLLFHERVFNVGGGVWCFIYNIYIYI